MPAVPTFDNFISPEIWSLIEQRYYARINEQARFENLILDPSFVHSEELHPAFFSDHGVVHMKDVACQVLAVLDKVHGALIPRRSKSRYQWMQGYAVLLACFHDIGMIDLSEFGRAMHPEAAAQAVFSPELEDVIQGIWRDNCGNVAGRLMSVAGADTQLPNPELMLRELLALSLGHSKSKVPIAALNNPQALRALVLEKVSTDLNCLYAKERVAETRQRLIQARETGADGSRLAWLQTCLDQAEKNLSSLAAEDQEEDSRINPNFYRHYADTPEAAFSWLTATSTEIQALIDDVIDSVRVLRCADSLRQRGTVLKTSGNYEIFVDYRSASAICAIRKGDEQLFLVEMPSTIGAGEANIVSSELEASGDLRIAFHRGLFSERGATEYASRCAAIVISGMKGDVLDSFQRASEGDLRPGMYSSSQLCILLEETDDNPDFVTSVKAQLIAMMPEMVDRIVIVPSLALATDVERQLYLAGLPLDRDSDSWAEFLNRIGESGQLVAEINVKQAFEHVRVANVASGQQLIEAGAPAGFVYIPLQPGLKVIPLGGYLSFSVKPWMPLGITGVIRGGVRNAAVVATEELQLLMIPKSVYFREWHRTYSREEFVRFMRIQNQKAAGN